VKGEDLIPNFAVKDAVALFKKEFRERQSAPVSAPPSASLPLDPSNAAKEQTSSAAFTFRAASPPSSSSSSSSSLPPPLQTAEGQRQRPSAVVHAGADDDTEPESGDDDEDIPPAAALPPLAPSLSSVHGAATVASVRASGRELLSDPVPWSPSKRIKPAEPGATSVDDTGRKAGGEGWECLKGGGSRGSGGSRTCHFCTFVNLRTTTACEVSPVSNLHL
jgi:hypothetical protein